MSCNDIWTQIVGPWKYGYWRPCDEGLKYPTEHQVIRTHKQTKMTRMKLFPQKDGCQ